MSIDEMKSELKKLRDDLSDLEDMHSFTFVKTSVHIGAEKAQNLQVEFDEERERYQRKIGEIEKLLRIREAADRV